MEEKKKIESLTLDDLEQVAGGSNNYKKKCRFCHLEMPPKAYQMLIERGIPCPQCGAPLS